MPIQNETERLMPTQLYMAFFLVLYVFLPSFILSVFLLLRVGSPALAFGCSHAVLPAAAFYLYRRGKISWRDVVLFVLVIGAAYGVSWWFFDFFHDGQAYFQPAIKRIAKGFNPVYDGYMDFGRAPDVWSEVATYYPKSIMYFAACLTAVFGDIQFGKASHIVLFAASIFYTAHVTRSESFLKKCVWYLACLNPIVLTECTTLVVDGDLGSLSLIGLLFAGVFFRGGVPSGVEYTLGIVSLALLFGVKTTGCPYGSIILFFICVNRLWVEYVKRSGESTGKRLFDALGSSFRLGLRLGGMVFLVSCVLNFHPYLTNLREGKNIFYPAVQSFRVNQPTGLDHVEDEVYPMAHNRFTRLLFSIMARAVPDIEPARIRNPFSSPFPDWRLLANGPSVHGGAMGPLFGIFLCLSVLAGVLLRDEDRTRVGENFWLLLTLLLMTFIQPYAWTLRYAPFVWLFPFVCLDGVSGKKERVLIVLLPIAAVNAGGLLFFFGENQWKSNWAMRQNLQPYEGEVVFLDRSIFDFAGIFDRFRLRQKYINPEEVLFHRFPEIGHLAWSRTPDGVNVFFPEDLLPLPEQPLTLNSEKALPWLRMSEGLVPIEIYREGIAETVWRSSGNKVRFFMKVDEKPKSGLSLILNGALYPASAGDGKELPVVVFVNHQPLGVWSVKADGGEKRFVIPRSLLEESFEDDGHLLILSLRIPSVSFMTLRDAVSPFGLRLDRLEFRPGSENKNENDGQVELR
ncbi:MAG: hypothetical protein LBR61_07720 [Synergistaceae bacterium]|jgi:hypothetical protein|nr:hypothetical protein [Synergistaceae bacterium]